MGILRIFLFGKFQVRCQERDLAGFGARKVQELLCYLLLYRDRPHPREMLADLLWSDTSTTQSKSYLRKALWQLQTVLDAQAEAGHSKVLLVEGDWVQLNPQANYWLDVAVFEQAFTLVQGVSGKELDDQQIQTLESAVELYQGNLLEGCYQDWCLYERERLQHIYLAMLDKLMAYWELHKGYETGIKYGVRALRYDRARERTHRRLIRLQYLAGYRTAALRQYQRCIAALDEELGVKPTQRTVALIEQIQADQVGQLTPALPEASQPAIATLPEILSRLQQLQLILADAQHQVQQDIQKVELAINKRR